MKLDPDYSKNKQMPKDAVAYITVSGKIVLHPKYFDDSWEDSNDKQWTGCIENGKISAPQEHFRGYRWEPEAQPLENCFFEGDLLPIIL